MLGLLHLAVSLAEVIPRVDGPWPSHVGPSLPFTAAGAAGVLGGMRQPDAPQGTRDRLINQWSRRGFWAGAVFYSLVVVVRLISPE
jgi:hypothetical protein